MHRNRTGFDLAIRLQILMEVGLSEATLNHLNAADLDNPMPFARLKAGRLRIDDKLSHDWIPTA